MGKDLVQLVQLEDFLGCCIQTFFYPLGLSAKPEELLLVRFNKEGAGEPRTSQDSNEVPGGRGEGSISCQDGVVGLQEGG